MADVTVKVLTPATSTALITLDELKLAFGIDPADTTHDAQLQMLIDQYSDAIATMCNRTFAKETVEETWRGDPPYYENNRVFLTRYPVADGDITSVGGVNGTLIDPANYEIENASGKLTLLGTICADPIVVTYSGGYDLPDAAPPALKAAAQLMVQAARAQMLRGFNPALRMVMHGDTRVMYYDPSTAKSLIGGDTMQNLLSAYMRFPA